MPGSCYLQYMHLQAMGSTGPLSPSENDKETS